MYIDRKIFNFVRNERWETITLKEAKAMEERFGCDTATVGIGWVRWTDRRLASSRPKYVWMKQNRKFIFSRTWSRLAK
jgi:hypothetical protein